MSVAFSFCPQSQYGGCEFPTKDKQVTFDILLKGNEVKEELIRNTPRDCSSGVIHTDFMSHKFTRGSHNILEKLVMHVSIVEIRGT